MMANHMVGCSPTRRRLTTWCECETCWRTLPEGRKAEAPSRGSGEPVPGAFF